MGRRKGSDPGCDIALTNRDGSYSTNLHRDGGDTSCCDCPNIDIKLRDRELKERTK